MCLTFGRNRNVGRDTHRRLNASPVTAVSPWFRAAFELERPLQRARVHLFRSSIGEASTPDEAEVRRGQEGEPGGNTTASISLLTSSVTVDVREDELRLVEGGRLGDRSKGITRKWGPDLGKTEPTPRAGVTPSTPSARRV